jgi:hypothetical protein
MHSMRLIRTVATVLVAQAVLCAAAPSLAGGEEDQVEVAPTRTGKERLGRKASDEQRVDNCKVPPALRGPKPRPDECAEEASTGAKR